MLGRLCIAAEALEECCVQSLADIFREGDGLGVAEDLDGLAGGVYYHAAIGTAGKVLFKIDSHSGVEDSV
jgi:hypothetical protein